MISPIRINRALQQIRHRLELRMPQELAVVQRRVGYRFVRHIAARHRVAVARFGGARHANAGQCAHHNRFAQPPADVHGECDERAVMRDSGGRIFGLIVAGQGFDAKYDVFRGAITTTGRDLDGVYEE